MLLFIYINEISNRFRYILKGSLLFFLLCLTFNKELFYICLKFLDITTFPVFIYNTPLDLLLFELLLACYLTVLYVFLVFIYQFISYCIVLLPQRFTNFLISNLVLYCLSLIFYTYIVSTLDMSVFSSNYFILLYEPNLVGSLRFIFSIIYLSILYLFVFHMLSVVILYRNINNNYRLLLVLPYIYAFAYFIPNFIILICLFLFLELYFRVICFLFKFILLI